jgi:hypothetical protein
LLYWVRIDSGETTKQRGEVRTFARNLASERPDSLIEQVIIAPAISRDIGVRDKQMPNT